jgi:transcriptional regulator with XRE-family HTH domain
MLSVVSDMESIELLADYVKRIRQEKQMSLADVERNSRRHGQGISNGYVSQIENGQMTNPSLDALIGLARGLGVFEDELFAVARGLNKVGELSLDEVRVLEFYRALPSDKKDDVLAHLELAYKRHVDTVRTGPKAGRVYEAVAGIPKLVKDTQRRPRKSSSKNNP